MEKHSIPRREILETIYIHLQIVHSMEWCTHSISHHNTVVEHLVKADGLLELIEEHDCGFIGGHDKGQSKRQTILDRFDWVYNKYYDTIGLDGYAEVVEFYKTR